MALFVLSHRPFRISEDVLYFRVNCLLVPPFQSVMHHQFHALPTQGPRVAYLSLYLGSVEPIRSENLLCAWPMKPADFRALQCINIQGAKFFEKGWNPISVGIVITGSN